MSEPSPGYGSGSGRSADVAAILDVRDAGRDRSPTARAVLLAGLHPAPADGPDPLELPVGARDARLVALRQDWFGTGVDCLAECERPWLVRARHPPPAADAPARLSGKGRENARHRALSDFLGRLAAPAIAPPEDSRAHEVPRARPAPPRRSASVSAPHDPIETAALATLPIAGPQVMTLLDTVSAAARPAAPPRRRSAAPEPRDVAASPSGTGARAEPPFAKPPPPGAPQVAGQLTALLASSARPESRMAPAPAERTPDVSIVIHRLEVRTPAETPRPARRGGTAVPALSLDAHLKSRSRP